MSTSLFSALLAAIDEDDEFVEKKRRIESSVDDSKAYPDANSTPPVLGSHQGFVRNGTAVAPVFPGLNNSWTPQSVGNPYQYCYIPYNNISVSSTLSTNLKENGDEAWKSSNPQESLIDHIPVLPGGYVPFQAMFQDPFFSALVRDTSFNYSLCSSVSKSQELDGCSTSRGSQDNYPFAPKPVRGNLLNFSPYALLTQNEELNVCATSQGPADKNTIDGSALGSVNKKKLGSSSYLGNASITTPLEGNNKAKLEPSTRHVFTPWLEHSAAEATQNTKAPLVTRSADQLLSKYPAANICVPEEEQEVERKDWVLLVQKELRNTDVGNLGRIVLPKRDAEANLPSLEAKNGLLLQMEDMILSIKWRFKYRYWPNNKSRMYVMENTGDFVKTHNLQTGDFFIVYKERNSGKLIARGMKGAVGR